MTDLRKTSKVRVGYVPYTGDLSSPADRRRFWFYAQRRNLDVELYRSSQSYDLVVVSTLADLTYWASSAPGGPKIVFDLPDSYFAISPLEPKALLRGTAKYLLKQHSQWEPDYRRTLQRMCERADAVTCSTPEQKQQIAPYANNVHAILDFHADDAPIAKQSYQRRGERLNLVWEGLAFNIFTLATIAAPLRAVAATRPLSIHVITDLTFKTMNGPAPSKSSLREAQKTLPGLDVNLYQWHRDTFAAVALSCDIAIIPMRLDMPICRAKAENKLLLFWRLGLPTLTAPTPAYLRTMQAAGLAMTCNTHQSWIDSITRWGNDEELRRTSGQTGRAFAEREYGVPAQMRRWDTMMASLGFEVQERASQAEERPAE